MSYFAIKHLHMTAAILSGIFFAVRGIWMMSGSGLLKTRWAKVAPHVIDTILLASALVLVFWSGQYPFVQGWLTAKVIALIGYIGAGMVALKYGKSKGIRMTAFFIALLLFVYILKVAVTRQVF
ncbi:MAG: SirB2 family protein [Burkholderiaceae bacterium]